MIGKKHQFFWLSYFFTRRKIFQAFFFLPCSAIMHPWWKLCKNLKKTFLEKSWVDVEKWENFWKKMFLYFFDFFRSQKFTEKHCSQRLSNCAFIVKIWRKSERKVEHMKNVARKKRFFDFPIFFFPKNKKKLRFPETLPLTIDG